MATDAASTALKAIDASATERLTAMAIAEASKSPRLIGPRTADHCTTKAAAKRCILIVKLGDSESTEIPLNETSLVPNSARVMSSLQLYGHALADIATADATEGVKAGLEKSVNAVTSIAGVFGLPVGPVLAPLQDAVVFGFQQYQNSIKLDALRRATKAADPIIKEAMTKLATEAELADTGTLARLGREYNAAFRVVEQGGASERNITTLIAAASRLDAALIINSSNVFAKVAEAHAALTEDLNNPNTSFADVLAAIDVVLTEAGHIQDFANALSAENR